MPFHPISGVDPVPGIDDRLTLSLTILIDAGYVGMLHVPFADGRGCTVQLAPRLTRLPRILFDAYHEDKDLPSYVRGFRTLDQIAELYLEYNAAGSGVSSSAIGRYIYDARRTIRKAVEASAALTGQELVAPDLFKQVRGGGYRIGDYGLSLSLLASRDACR